MLITCPECELPVSDKAKNCPHCGYPMKPEIKPRLNKKSRMRLPNGFGQISEIKGQNLRNPYRAMVTVSKNQEGKPICKILKPQGYFPTYNDAYAALIEYNKNPYDLEDDIRMQELYDRWSEYYFKTLKSESSMRGIKSCWSYCSSIYNMRVKDVRARHIKGCMDDGFIIVNGEKKTTTPNLKSRIKSMFNLMLDYAVEYEIVDRNYARTFDVSSEVFEDIETMKRAHLSFKTEELCSLELNRNFPFIDLVIYQCWSGWRPQELGLILTKNVDLLNGTITGGSKTKAGINRVVPIHSSVREFIEKTYEDAIANNREYLFCDENGKRLTYDKYWVRFNRIINELKLNPDHRPHDPRKQFITMAKKYGVDEHAIKRIVGHTERDITERVYTDREITWLCQEIEKIPGNAIIANPGLVKG